MLKKKGFGLIVLVILSGCSEVYQPDIETVDAFLVVEGHISTSLGNSYVSVCNSKSFNDNPYFEGQTGAIVRVADDQGNTFTYTDRGNGNYSVILDEENRAYIGRTYTLSVTLADGTIYESTPQKIVQCPPLNKLSCAYDQETVLTENSYGDILEVNLDGIDIIIGTDGLLPSDNFYLYDWKAYEEHYSVIMPKGNPMMSFELYRHRTLNGKYLNIVRTADADQYPNCQMKDENVLFIAKEDMTKYTPIYDTAVYDLVGNQFQGLLFTINQKSLSADAYSFYYNVEKQLEAEDRLFDPVSPQIVGNISCVSDPSKKVIGVFYACDVSQRISYLYIDNKNHTYSRRLDSLPELWLDTCSWQRPADWISIPY
jgi:hypothetical protein